MKTKLMIRELIGEVHGYDHDSNTHLNTATLISAQVDFIHDGGHTNRFHTVRTITTNTVAEHSHGVAMLVYLLLGEKTSVGVLMAALTHDLAEHKTGDVPAPAKRTLGIRESLGEVEDALLDSVYLGFALTPCEQMALKFADAADGTMFCIRERRLGNIGITVAYNNFYGYLLELNRKAKVAAKTEAEFMMLSSNMSTIVSKITTMWEESV